jgi:hypothetical protein
VTFFPDDLDRFMAAAADRGVRPERTETYGDAVRKITFLDPDGNEIGVGGVLVETD